jgi:hypothetical protein
MAAKKCGRIVARGTPEQVARVKKSYTGQALTGYSGGEWEAERVERPEERGPHEAKGIFDLSRLWLGRVAVLLR